VLTDILFIRLQDAEANVKNPHCSRKSISAERTFRDEDNEEKLKEICWKIASKIAERMQRTTVDSDSEDDETANDTHKSDEEGSSSKRVPFKGKTVTIKLKYVSVCCSVFDSK
jgi:nucleotidyltransferase/DNA polymerase involved in DNA repair